jgi:predicted enzyme related to lactoylglutathione lyase
MTEMTHYDHGVPSWVDIGAPDIAAAIDFYARLFGWEGEDRGEEFGHYTVVQKNGKNVAAISPAQDSGPPRWTTYINVDDLDAVTDKVRAAGGTVVFGPMEVMTEGKMAIFKDTTGAFIAAWQPGETVGAELVNGPGAMTWNELSTSDLDKSKAFYSAVFGWEWGGAEEYAEVEVGGRTVGGVMPRTPGMPAEVPDYWLVYFGTADLDADLERASELGATVLVGTTEIPTVGRFAVLLDPQGATFALYQR